MTLFIQIPSTPMTITLTPDELIICWHREYMKVYQTVDDKYVDVSHQYKGTEANDKSFASVASIWDNVIVEFLHDYYDAVPENINEYRSEILNCDVNK